jgi:hypothetical protein
MHASHFRQVRVKSQVFWAKSRVKSRVFRAKSRVKSQVFRTKSRVKSQVFRFKFQVSRKSLGSNTCHPCFALFCHSFLSIKIEPEFKATCKKWNQTYVNEIIVYSYFLATFKLQFGFKAGYSTSMCSMILKETLDY